MAPITGIRTWRRRLMLRQPFVTALRSTSVAESVVVEVVAGDGSSGTGEATPVRAVSGETLESVEAAIRDRLAPAVTGLAVGDLDGALRAVAATGSGDPSARAGVDLALHDLACRRAGVSLHRLLGVADVAVPTDVTISVADPDRMALDAKEAVAAGFDVVKLKLGRSDAGVDTGSDVDRVRAVREAVGAAVRLRLDANQAWTPADAVTVLDALAHHGAALDLVEQPVAAGDLAGMRWVSERTDVPVVADEAVWSAADVRAVAASGAASVVNLKLMKFGGLAPARAATTVAEDEGLGWMVGCMMEGPRAVAGAVVLAGGGPAATVHDLDAAWWLADGTSRCAGGRLHYEQGRIRVTGADDPDEEH